MANSIHPYEKNSLVHNFLFHPLYEKTATKKTGAVITNIFFTIITLGLWLIPFWIVNRLDEKKIEVWKKELANEKKIPKVQDVSLQMDTDKSDMTKWPKAKIYMSLTGNPTHLGHMMIIATAIVALFEKNIYVDEVLISLSGVSYHENKVKRDLAKNIKKVALSQIERIYLLQGAIKEATERGFFKDVRVNYWNDQDKGPSDHPDSYLRLAKQFKKTHRIYLVAGTDLCIGMDNWPSVECAIIVQRKMKKDAQPDVYPPSNKERIYVRPLDRIVNLSSDDEIANLSSSKIQDGSMTLSPPALQEYFLQACGKAGLSTPCGADV